MRIEGAGPPNLAVSDASPVAGRAPAVPFASAETGAVRDLDTGVLGAGVTSAPIAEEKRLLNWYRGLLEEVRVSSGSGSGSGSLAGGVKW